MTHPVHILRVLILVWQLE